MHDYSRIACLLVASPERPFAARAWLDEQLRAHWGCVWEPGTKREPQLNDPAQRSWVVGSVVGGETLLQTRPIVRDPGVAFIDDFLRAPSHCTVAGYRAHQANNGIRSVAPARYARWACVCLADEVTQRWQEQPQLRSDLCATIPDFIVRHFGTPSDEEVLFMTYLAELHERTGLSPTRVTLELSLDAMLAVDLKLQASLGIVPQLDLWIVDGKAMQALHRGSQVALVKGPRVETPAVQAIGLRAKQSAPALLLSTAATRGVGGTLVPQGVFGIEAKDPSRLVTRLASPSSSVPASGATDAR